MKFPKDIIVTDQRIDISEFSEQQKRYYLSIAEDIKNRYLSAGRGRQIFTLSGPAGAGKSVMVTIFNFIFQNDPEVNFVNVGLDAFHFHNKRLQELELLAHKGRYDTYDLDLIVSKLIAFKAGDDVMFPVYSRQEHNPVSDRIRIDTADSLLFLEGQWLLRDDPDWQAIRDLSTANYFVSGSMESMKQGVVKRHVTGGRDSTDAEKFYNSNDLPNSKEVLSSSVNPDIEIAFYKEI